MSTIEAFRSTKVPSQAEVIGGWVSTDNCPVVSVICIAFNHEKYIDAAIRGILAQKTSFSFEIIVHDDASTDGTAAIVSKYASEYPLIVKPVLQVVNQYSQGNKPTLIAFSSARGEYIAFCEGDDFWVARDKLQIQYDYMQKSPSVSLVHADAAHLVTFRSPFDRICNGVNKKFGRDYPEGDCKSNVLGGSFGVYTCTMLIRRAVLDEYVDSGVLDVFFRSGDYGMFLFSVFRGRIGYIDKTVAVYRETPGSLMNSNGRGLILFPYYNRNLIEFVARYFSLSKDDEGRLLRANSGRLYQIMFRYAKFADVREFGGALSNIQRAKIFLTRFVGVRFFFSALDVLKKNTKKAFFYKDVA